MADDQRLQTESTELLRTLIRNACVNSGGVASGGEVRNVDALEAYFADRLETKALAKLGESSLSERDDPRDAEYDRL